MTTLKRIIEKIGERFRTFGGGMVNSENPISHALKDCPLHFAGGVDVADVVIFVAGELGAIPVKPRPLSEWHEEIGDVLWWKFPITEPPYCGSPLCLGFTVESETVIRRHNQREVRKTIREEVGGWPGYHTHWTPLPDPPEEPKP